jgi:hypothetical protein
MTFDYCNDTSETILRLAICINPNDERFTFKRKKPLFLFVVVILLLKMNMLISNLEQDV